MDYKNTEIKLEALVTYFSQERINLNPVFQRGSVWVEKDRRELIKNIVLRRPIPAIFVYKDDNSSGSAYKYNVLDGKQRLESLLLFIGYDRQDFKVDTWAKYIPVGDLRSQFNFSAPLGVNGKLLTLKQLDPVVVRDLRDYMIPMIEIEFNENTSLDELINLFVDINQKGAKVTRLQIVRALKTGDPFLKDAYGLVAQKQKRHQAQLVKKKDTDYAFVLSRLQIVANAPNTDQKADRMWERMFELALFARSKKHRKPAEILKSFINGPNEPTPKISKSEHVALKRAFEFLAFAYRKGVAVTRFATDQTHFYTLATTLIGTDILKHYSKSYLTQSILDFDALLSKPSDWKVPGLPKLLKSYQETSAKQTSDSARRAERQRILVDAIEILVLAKGGEKKEIETK